MLQETGQESVGSIYISQNLILSKILESCCITGFLLQGSRNTFDTGIFFVCLLLEQFDIISSRYMHTILLFDLIKSWQNV